MKPLLGADERRSDVRDRWAETLGMPVWMDVMAGRVDHWSYDRQPRVDRSGRRWHFVSRLFPESEVPYEERPFELYFRDDERTEFGVLRFDRRKDNPYRDYETMVTKIMNDSRFRQALLDPATADVWRRSWN